MILGNRNYPFDDGDRLIRASWDANAAAWNTSVRDGLIPSRRAGTDAAILEACLRFRPRRVLDVGCGEGWLARALTGQGIKVIGIDATAALVQSARDAGCATYEVIDYEVLDYEVLVKDPAVVPGPFDVIVCNYSLFGDPLAPLLAALRQRLGTAGRLLIQTVHPWIAAGDGLYTSGWREETFADFPVEFPAAMPWYFRTLESWAMEIQRAGLVVTMVEEPLNPSSGRPLSLILGCCGGR